MRGLFLPNFYLAPQVFQRYGSGCLCGAIAGSQMVIGYIHGRGKTEKARALAKEFIEEFKKTHKATCCRVLSAGFDFHSPERKSHCTNMVYDCAKFYENNS